MKPVQLNKTELDTISIMVDDVRHVYETGKSHSVEYRKQQLHALYDFFVKEKEGILDALYKDLRKPYVEGYITEIAAVKNDIVTAIKELDEWMEPVTASRPLAFLLDRAETRHVPLGVVLIIGTWNYPVNLSLAPLVGAIAGGNGAIIKFSEVCVHISNFLAKTLPNYLDNTMFKFVNGEIPETTVLLEQRFDLIFYTGNSMVARIIMKAAIKYMTPTVLELGGKSPVIVDESSDPKIAAKRVMWGKTLNAGQTCVAPDYVLVHKKVAKEFIGELQAVTNELLGTEDHAISSEYARIGSERHCERLASMVDKQLKVPGTKLLFGGKSDIKDRYMSPTVLVGVGKDPSKNPVMESEIFGPILPVIEVDSIEEALEYVKTRSTPLAYYPFSKNSASIEKMLSGVNGGNATVNGTMINLL
ncbi:Aldehyde dehydrogenase, partial [Globomyces sp. JEL0801]